MHLLSASTVVAFFCVCYLLDEMNAKRKENMRTHDKSIRAPIVQRKLHLNFRFRNHLSI